MKFLLVFLGSGIGGVIRYGISLGFAPSHLKFPWGTFIANMMAAFLVGLFYSISIQKQWMDKNLLILLTIGLCGGLSTFSTFSIETLKLWQSQQYGMGVLYILLSVAVCVGFTFLGSKLAS